MRYLMIIILLLAAACGGTLSDEQRKKMHEQMALHKIRKVSEAEITEAGFARGRKMIKTLENLQGDKTRIDSFIRAEDGKVRWITPGAKDALALEQQLIDAYLTSGGASLLDNVQEIRQAEGGTSDSLLYTKPVVTKLPDGRDQLEGVWNIWLSKKQLILAMDKK